MFAIEAVVDIAYNAADTPVQSKDIATRQNIPRRYLEQVLQQLVREGVLGGVDKTIIESGSNVTPYLPLPELKRRAEQPVATVEGTP